MGFLRESEQSSGDQLPSKAGEFIYRKKQKNKKKTLKALEAIPRTTANETFIQENLWKFILKRESLVFESRPAPPHPKKKVPDHGGGCSGRYQKENKIDFTKIIQPIIKHTAENNNMKWGGQYPVFLDILSPKMPSFQ